MIKVKRAPFQFGTTLLEAWMDVDTTEVFGGSIMFKIGVLANTDWAIMVNICKC